MIIETVGSGRWRYWNFADTVRRSLARLRGKDDSVVEWVEAEDRGVCRSAGSARAVPDFFLDSSVLTFPVINDLLLIELSIQKPARMPLYAAMAMTGSVLGCVLLYFISKKGGEAFFHKKAGERGAAIRRWVVKNGFGGMLAAQRCCHRQRRSRFLYLPRVFLKCR